MDLLSSRYNEGDLNLDSGRDQASSSAVSTGASARASSKPTRTSGFGLYTPEQQIRRDKSIWTIVQGVLAPLQFLAFIVSLILVLRYLNTGIGHDVAALSVLVKTTFLLAIMVTGSLWERDVFGCYLFAPAFFWEDVVSFGVIALHLAYVFMFAFSYGDATQQMLVALAAYAAYLVNAGQFLWKFRLARTGRERGVSQMGLVGESAL